VQPEDPPSYYILDVLLPCEPSSVSRGMPQPARDRQSAEWQVGGQKEGAGCLLSIGVVFARAAYDCFCSAVV
jgi:hypothetical protein